MSTIDDLKAIVEGLGAVRAAATETAAHVEKEAQRIVQAVTRQSEALTKGRRDIEEMAESGNQWAQMLQGIAQSVEEGLTPALAAVNAFGDGLVTLEGKTRSVRDWISDMGLQQAEVDLRNLAKATTDYTGLVEILNTLQGAQAQMVAKLIDAYAKGNATLDEVLQKLREAQRAEGALADVAKGLAEALQNGGRTGKI